MTPNTNSASRLYSLLQKHSSYSGSAQVMDTWAKILGVDEDGGVRKASIVASRIKSIHDELDILSAQMKSTTVKPDKYQRQFNQIEQALTPMLFTGSWNQVQQYITPDVLSTLQIFQDLLPDEERQIDIEELNEIEALLKEIEATLSSDELPERLRLLITRHIELIRNSIQEYSIKGAKTLQRAVREGV